jgi:hypothetical protein
MKIEYTARYLKDFRDIRDKKAIKATEAVEKKINSVNNIVELYRVLDIQKYDTGLGGYRIRYGGKPEYRIRFELIDDPENPKEKMVLLQLVLPREKYQKYAHTSVNESVETPRMRIVISESQLRLLKQLQ